MQLCQTCNPATPLTNCVCPDVTQSGEVVVMDDNCRPRRLIGKGILFQAKDSSAQLTDGSEKNGLIVLDPPSTPSGDGLTVIDASGTVLKLDQFNEGDVLTIEAGQIRFKSKQDQQNTYDPFKLRDGVGRLAIFLCGPNGTVGLGRYDGCTEGLLGFTEDVDIAPAKTPTCISYEFIATKMQALLCAQVANMAEADVKTANLVCTNNGIKKEVEVVDTAGLMTHRAPWDSIGYSTPAMVADQVMFSFNPTLLPGYDPKYKTMWLHTRLIASSHGADYQVIVKLGSQDIHNGIIREQPSLTVDFINPTYVFPFPVSNTTLNVRMLLSALNGNTGQIYEWGYEMKLVAWQK